MSTKTARRWEREYARKGIPSSYRTRPSSPVLVGLKAVRARTFKGLRALDIGCGRGRNALYLARKGFEAHAMDFAPGLAREVAARAKKMGLAGKVFPVCRDVTKPWPYAKNYFDFAADIFCYKHQTKTAARRSYREELARVLKKGAVYVLSLASPEDGFYGSQRSPKGQGKGAPMVVTDSYTGIGSALFTKADVEKEFGPRGEFRLEQFVERRKRGRMHGKTYLRVTLIFVFRKK